MATEARYKRSVSSGTFHGIDLENHLQSTISTSMLHQQPNEKAFAYQEKSILDETEENDGFNNGTNILPLHLIYEEKVIVNDPITTRSFPMYMLYLPVVLIVIFIFIFVAICYRKRRKRSQLIVTNVKSHHTPNNSLKSMQNPHIQARSLDVNGKRPNILKQNSLDTKNSFLTERKLNISVVLAKEMNVSKQESGSKTGTEV